MALISNAIPNLVGGVSQQPPALRTSSSCAAMENAWPSVVSGLMKRQSTEFIKKLDVSVSNGAMCYVIDRDASYRYIAIFSNDNLSVFDLDGNEQTVTFPKGKAYLTQAESPVDSFRFVTLGDTTFILNREVVVRDRIYGEAGEASGFAPDGVVDYKSELPSAVGSTNLVYYVTTEGDYFKATVQPEVPASTYWLKTTEWRNDIPAGYTLSSTSFGTALPSKAVAGAKIYIRRYKNKAYTYQGYTGTYTPPVSVPNKWLEVPLKSLTPVSSQRQDPDELATIHVTNSVPNAYYAIYINNVKKAEFLTSNNVDAANAVQGTDVIATKLSSATGSGVLSLTTSGYSFVRYGSTISISGLSATDEVTAWTTNGDKSMKAYRDSVKSFSELPPNERVGRVVRIKGDPTELRDDYFVVYNSKKEWDECEAYNTGTSLRDETMPHVLVRNEDGTWTFKPHKWDNRLAGDFESNPSPSFVGHTINDIFTYSNRLGFVSDENIILSETDKFENFYRTTLAQLLDSDVIDFAVLHNNVNILQHAVPFNNDLILFSDQNQFRFSYNNFLNQKNVQVKFTTAFNCARRSRPVPTGSSVYFVDDVSTSRYAKLWEYYPKDDLISDDAEEATAAVPEYIPAGVRFMQGSTRVKALVVGTDGDRDSLFVYKYFWAGDKKIQNAWGKWKFTDCSNIYWSGFVNNYLYLLLRRSDGIFLERMKFDEDVFTSAVDYDLLLDARVTLDPSAVAYNVSTNTSTLTLPYLTSATVEVISSTTPITDGILDSIRNTVTRVNDDTVRIPGDARDLVLTVGIPYSFLYEFSTPYLKQNKGASAGVTVLDGRLQMRYLSIEYHNTAFFTTKVRLPGRPDYNNTFNGRVIGSEQTTLGQATFLTGTFRMPLMGKNTELRFWLLNDSPFPSTFGSAEWQAMYSPRSAMRI